MRGSHIVAVGVVGVSVARCLVYARTRVRGRELPVELHDGVADGLERREEGARVAHRKALQRPRKAVCRTEEHRTHHAVAFEDLLGCPVNLIDCAGVPELHLVD